MAKEETRRTGEKSRSASASTSELLDGLKGRIVEVTTMAGAHVGGVLKEMDRDFLLVVSGTQEILVPRTNIAMITLGPLRRTEESLQEAA